MKHQANYVNKYICIYIHIYASVHLDTYIYKRTLNIQMTYINLGVHVYIHAYVYTYLCIYTHTYIRSWMDIYIYMLENILMCVYIYLYMYIYIQKYTANCCQTRCLQNKQNIVLKSCTNAQNVDIITPTQVFSFIPPYFRISTSCA